MFVTLLVADDAAVKCSILSSTHFTFLPESLEAKHVRTIMGSMACLIPKLPPES